MSRKLSNTRFTTYIVCAYKQQLSNDPIEKVQVRTQLVLVQHVQQHTKQVKTVLLEGSLRKLCQQPQWYYILRDI